MSRTLFSEFDPVSEKEWKQKIQFDLKGADYNDLLIHETLEGIDIKPFYHKDSISTPLTVIHPESWKIAEIIRSSNPQECINEAAIAIEKGVESLHFTLHELPTALLKSLKETKKVIDIHFFLKNTGKEIRNSFERLEDVPKNWYFYSDPIGDLSHSGNWRNTQKEDFDDLEEFLKIRSKTNRYLSINSSIYQNAGANCVQQVAYALAHVHEYIHYFKNTNETLKNDLKFLFKVSIGSNFFMEISKIRAIRMLFEILAKEYNLLKKCYIFAQPSKRNKSILDYNVNILRTTTECMSAVLGGADIVANNAYDLIYQEKNEFSEHIARNQLHILKEECYFDQVETIANGSYYIEELTKQISEKALSLFKDLEKSGGLMAHLKKGTIQQKIKENARKEQELIDTGKLKMVGANSFKNREAFLPISKTVIKTRKNKVKTIITPIKNSRLSEKLEKKTIFEGKI